MVGKKSGKTCFSEKVSKFDYFSSFAIFDYRESKSPCPYCTVAFSYILPYRFLLRARPVRIFLWLHGKRREAYRTSTVCCFKFSCFNLCMGNVHNFGTTRFSVKHEKAKRLKYLFGTLHGSNRATIKRYGKLNEKHYGPGDKFGPPTVLSIRKYIYVYDLF